MWILGVTHDRCGSGRLRGFVVLLRSILVVVLGIKHHNKVETLLLPLEIKYHNLESKYSAKFAEWSKQKKKNIC